MKKVFVSVAFLFILFILIKKMKGSTSQNKIEGNLPDLIRGALNDVATKYGINTAKVVEKMYRIETNHFKSKQFLNTYSAGMEKHREKFPYGWFSMAKLWTENETLAPNGFYEIREGKGLMNDKPKIKTFLKFPSVRAAMFALAEYLQTHRPGVWYAGTDKERATAYENTLNEIKNRYV